MGIKVNSTEICITAKSALKWAIFGICVGASFVLLIGTWLIVRITDGNWANWQLPVIFIIAWFMIVIVTAMLFAIPDAKHVISETFDKDKEEQK